MLKLMLGAIVAGTVLLPGAGFACEGGKVLLEDKFEKFNPAWGFTLDPASEKIDTNGLSFDYQPNYYRRGISQLSYFTNYVACATFTVSYTCTNPSQCESQPYVGLVVLAADTKNFYTFEVAAAYGTYSLSRVQNNKWLYPIGWTSLPDGKKFQSGDTVELQATVQGANMKFKVDGKEVLEFDGVAVEDGSLVGFEIGTYQVDTRNSQFSLSNLQVRELGPTQ